MVEEFKLNDIAKKLLAPGKGILAADESVSTCEKRFARYSISQTPEMRRRWREILVTTAGIENGLSGVILFDETIRQETSAGIPFAEYVAGRGIIPGIKVDQKTESLVGSHGEEVTKGLEGLPERLREYTKREAKFTKWRAVIRIGNGLPTDDAAIRENARRMAKYAFESQKAGLVPIIEPEVLLDGTHGLARAEEVVRKTLETVFAEVKSAGVAFGGLLLKTSMVLPGKDSWEKRSAREIAEATVRALLASVPREVSGVVFLSGGQTPEEATERLNEIVKEGKAKHAPWPLSFSFSRALQDPVLAAWAGKDENTRAAQEIFAKRVSEAATAARGEYSR